LSSVPRSMEAISPPGAALVARRRIAWPNGLWGMLLLIATEATLFGCLLGTYAYLRFHVSSWPPYGIPAPHPLVPLVLAGVLAATSVPMQVAASAGMRGRRMGALAAVAAALVVQAGYFAYEIHSFRDDLGHFTPQGSAYGSIYYTLLGADHFHVAVGLLLDLWLVGRLATGLTNYRLTGLRAVTMYWHFVNLLTIAVVVTIVSPGL